MRRTRLVPVVALAALALPLTGAPAIASGPKITRITLTMSDCSGCKIAAYNTASSAFKNTGKPVDTAKVHRNKAVFDVPASLTKGLAFTLISTGKYTMVGAHPDIALDISGVKAGRQVSTAKAKAAPGARRCWAGTTAAAVTIPISTFTYQVRDYTDDHKLVTSIAFWASTDQKGYGKATKFDSELRGYPGVAQLANQDAPYCT